MKQTIKKILILPIILFTCSTFTVEHEVKDDWDFYIEKSLKAQITGGADATSKQLHEGYEDGNMPEVPTEKDPFKNVTIMI